jgi:hypothetical protein
MAPISPKFKKSYCPFPKSPTQKGFDCVKKTGGRNLTVGDLDRQLAQLLLVHLILAEK